RKTRTKKRIRVPRYPCFPIIGQTATTSTCFYREQSEGDDKRKQKVRLAMASGDSNIMYMDTSESRAFFVRPEETGASGSHSNKQDEMSTLRKAKGRPTNETNRNPSGSSPSATSSGSKLTSKPAGARTKRKRETTAKRRVRIEVEPVVGSSAAAQLFRKKRLALRDFAQQHLDQCAPRHHVGRLFSPHAYCDG
ncbi:unnamed protein product, partial [Amoebophrya sp. A25]